MEYYSIFNVQTDTQTETITFPPRLALGGFPAFTTLAGPVDSVGTKKMADVKFMNTDRLKTIRRQERVEMKAGKQQIPFLNDLDFGTILVLLHTSG